MAKSDLNPPPPNIMRHVLSHSQKKLCRKKTRKKIHTKCFFFNFLCTKFVHTTADYPISEMSRACQKTFDSVQIFAYLLIGTCLVGFSWVKPSGRFCRIKFGHRITSKIVFMYAASNSGVLVQEGPLKLGIIQTPEARTHQEISFEPGIKLKVSAPE